MQQFKKLAQQFKGFLFYDDSTIHQTQLLAYATDASVYQEKPLAVSIPKDIDDLKLLIKFATEHGLTLIPRAAGTSLAGQVVGSGRKYIKLSIGFHPDKSIPLLHKTTLLKWYKKHKNNRKASKKTVYLFCDEFTNYNDVEIGKTTILLLEALGFQVIIPKHLESGRTYLSKGFVKKAKVIANKNIALLNSLITAESPLVGVEPSAILTLRDEYIDLADAQNREKSRMLAKHTFTIEEFLANEIDKGNITEALFSSASQDILIHGHCYQKALSSERYLMKILNLPKNCSATLIPSDCCGMAGSFG